MQKEVKKDILNILKKSIKLIKENNTTKLKELSNHTIHDASIFQDNYSTQTAVLIYALAKIYERTRYKQFKTWPLFNKTVKETIKKATISLEKDNLQDYEKSIQNLLSIINKLEHKLKNYIKEVIEKAKIHKASRIHEHGISVEKTASILGISEWELMDYIGSTGIPDMPHSVTKNVIDRIKYTRSIFK